MCGREAYLGELAHTIRHISNCKRPWVRNLTKHWHEHDVVNFASNVRRMEQVEERATVIPRVRPLGF